MSTNSKWESPRINSGSELALRAEKERLNRLAMEHYKRLTGEAQEEIARLQAGIAALRERWEERRAAWNLRHTQIITKETVSAIIEAALANRIYAITGAIEELDALFPPEADTSGNQRRNDETKSVS